jgi:hypothetical protein
MTFGTSLVIPSVTNTNLFIFFIHNNYVFSAIYTDFLQEVTGS